MPWAFLHLSLSCCSSLNAQAFWSLFKTFVRDCLLVLSFQHSSPLPPSSMRNNFLVILMRYLVGYSISARYEDVMQAGQSKPLPRQAFLPLRPKAIRRRVWNIPGHVSYHTWKPVWENKAHAQRREIQSRHYLVPWSSCSWRPDLFLFSLWVGYMNFSFNTLSLFEMNFYHFQPSVLM